MTLTERTSDALAWIDAQLALCNAATESPWRIGTQIWSVLNKNGREIAQCGSGLVPSNDYEKSRKMTEANSEFIAAARTGYPEMLEGMKLAIETISYTQIDIKHIGTLEKILETILSKIEALQ